jgi:acetyl esterase
MGERRIVVKKMMILFATCILFLIASSFLLVYSWSNTPYGKLDFRLAIPFKLLGMLEKFEKKSDEEIRNGFINPIAMKKMRQQVSAGAAMTSKTVLYSGNITEKLIENEIPVRIYSPEGGGPFPLLVFYHGAGFTFGDLEFSDNLCRSVSQKGSIVVVSVDYRLAPEHPFPSGLTDAYDALLWTYKNARVLNAIPERIAVGGESSGGNLAASVSLMCKEKKPDLVNLQILIYPILDLANLESDSYNKFATGYGLTKQQMAHVINAYVRDKADLTNELASPIYARDLKNLPPTLIISAKFDVLRDEGETYAKKLVKAGVSVNHVRYDTMAHGFITANRLVKEAEVAIDVIVAEIKSKM